MKFESFFFFVWVWGLFFLKGTQPKWRKSTTSDTKSKQKRFVTRINEKDGQERERERLPILGWAKCGNDIVTSICDLM